jgi:hypothetical protein
MTRLDWVIVIGVWTLPLWCHLAKAYRNRRKP